MASSRRRSASDKPSSGRANCRRSSSAARARERRSSSRAASEPTSRFAGRTAGSGSSSNRRRTSSLELARNALTSASASRPLRRWRSTAATIGSWAERATPQSASASVTPIDPASTHEATDGSRPLARTSRLETHSTRRPQSVAIPRGPSRSSTRSAWTTRASSMGESVRRGAFACRRRTRVSARVLVASTTTGTSHAPSARQRSSLLNPSATS